MKFGIEKKALSRSVRVDQIQTSRSGSRKGRPRSSTALTMLKTAVFAPIPTARIRMAAVVNPGLLLRPRAAYRRSLTNVSIDPGGMKESCQVPRERAPEGIRARGGGAAGGQRLGASAPGIADPGTERSSFRRDADPLA